MHLGLFNLSIADLLADSLFRLSHDSLLLSIWRARVLIDDKGQCIGEEVRLVRPICLHSIRLPTEAMLRRASHLAAIVANA